MNKTYYESDHLAHWKYIKKVRKNGQWVYYYDKDDNELTKLKTEERLRKRVESTAFKGYTDRVYKQDLEKANKNIKNLPEGPDNVKRWYNSSSVQRSLKEAAPKGMCAKFGPDRFTNKIFYSEHTTGGAGFAI